MQNWVPVGGFELEIYFVGKKDLDPNEIIVFYAHFKGSFLFAVFWQGIEAFGD